MVTVAVVSWRLWFAALAVLIRDARSRMAAIVDHRVVERARIARIAIERERDAERDRILRHHLVVGRRDVVARGHALIARDDDRYDVGGENLCSPRKSCVASTGFCAVMWQA